MVLQGGRRENPRLFSGVRHNRLAKGYAAVVAGDLPVGNARQAGCRKQADGEVRKQPVLEAPAAQDDRFYACLFRKKERDTPNHVRHGMVKPQGDLRNAHPLHRVVGDGANERSKPDLKPALRLLYREGIRRIRAGWGCDHLKGDRRLPLEGNRPSEVQKSGDRIKETAAGRGERRIYPVGDLRDDNLPFLSRYFGKRGEIGHLDS